MGLSYYNADSLYNKYKENKLSLKSEHVPKVLDEQQLFWVRETIGAVQRGKFRYCRAHGIPYPKLKKWTEMVVLKFKWQNKKLILPLNCYTKL